MQITREIATMVADRPYPDDENLHLEDSQPQKDPDNLPVPKDGGLTATSWLYNLEMLNAEIVCSLNIRSSNTICLILAFQN